MKLQTAINQRSVILGTAGHIDHGKTALVKALTGIDTDRLKEEQRRGITIELGFAHMRLGDIQFSVIDVPGHERFIKSMVAGVGGIDSVMLVVAADEGVMPQTREHLDICQLLGVKQGLVALTKVDLVNAEWLQLVTEDLTKTLKQTFLEGAPLVPCSVTTGGGLDELRQVLLNLAAHTEPRDPHGLLRLPLDRVFSIKGFGTVVTGTLLSGTLVTGQEVIVLPGEIKGKVRGIQVHGQTVDQALAGQRTAVNLSGVDRQEIARGEVLVFPDTLTASSMIDVTLKLLSGTRKRLPNRSKVLFHSGTRQQEATCILLDTPHLEPGQSGLAQIRFEQPVVALPHDRFILRGFHKQENYGTTIGGGEVIHVLARKLRPRDQPEIQRLHQMQQASPEERVAVEVQNVGFTGLTRLQLQQRLPIVPDELDKIVVRLREQGKLVRFDKDSGAMVHAEHFMELSRIIQTILQRFHHDHPLEPGMNREELRSRIGLGEQPRLFFSLLQSLEKAGKLIVEREYCYLSQHTVQNAAHSIRPLMEKIRQVYLQMGLGPPRDTSLAAELQTNSEAISSAIKLLVDEGSLVRVSDLFFPRAALEDLRVRLINFLASESQITPTQFKELVGQSRKFSIPLAEYFDSQKLTIRVGEVRRLRK